MTTAIAIEDVRREVKILKGLSGHRHLVKFYDAYEDSNNVYIVMEWVFSCSLPISLNKKKREKKSFMNRLAIEILHSWLGFYDIS